MMLQLELNWFQLDINLCLIEYLFVFALEEVVKYWDLISGLMILAQGNWKQLSFYYISVYGEWNYFSNIQSILIRSMEEKSRLIFTWKRWDQFFWHKFVIRTHLPWLANNYYIKDTNLNIIFSKYQKLITVLLTL